MTRQTCPLYIWGALQLLFYKVFPEMQGWGCTDLQKHSLASPAQGVGSDALRMELQLHAEFQPHSPDGAGTYSEHTCIHTLPNIYEIFVFYLSQGSIWLYQEGR